MILGVQVHFCPFYSKMYRIHNAVAHFDPKPLVYIYSPGVHIMTWVAHLILVCTMCVNTYLHTLTLLHTCTL